MCTCTQGLGIYGALRRYCCAGSPGRGCGSCSAGDQTQAIQERGLCVCVCVCVCVKAGPLNSSTNPVNSHLTLTYLDICSHLREHHVASPRTQRRYFKTRFVKHWYINIYSFPISWARIHRVCCTSDITSPPTPQVVVVRGLLVSDDGPPATTIWSGWSFERGFENFHCTLFTYFIKANISFIFYSMHGRAWFGFGDSQQYKMLFI